MPERLRGQTVLIVDGGGRGAVLADKYAQSPHVGRVLVVPGNDLVRINIDKKQVETFPNLKNTSVDAIVGIVAEERVDLVDVAQDNAVEVGVVDALRGKTNVVGPTSAAGKIESDKAGTREKGERWGLPQPRFHRFSSERAGLEFLENQSDGAWFVKASGLAEGKGALPAENNDEAAERVREMKGFKDGAGEVYVIEEWIKGDDGSEGEEFSAFAVSDGERHKTIGYAQDHKRVNNFDQGPNTGGMGCSAPPLLLTPDLKEIVERDILDKAFEGQRAERHPYKGVLYLGGMAVKREGTLKPYVVEFNARWGDPEAQAIVPGLDVDFFELGMAIAQGDISNIDISSDGKARVVVAGASKGYPPDYSEVRDKEIFGLYDVANIDGVSLYTAGVTVDSETGKTYASGGRLFYVVGEGENVIEAREKAYQGISRVFVEGNNLHYRTDIGWRDVQRLRS